MRWRVVRRGILDTLEQSLLVVDAETQIESVHEAFCHAFGVSAERVVGEPLFEVDRGAWDVAELRRAIDALRGEEASYRKLAITHAFPRVGQRSVTIAARRLSSRLPGARSESCS